MTGSFMLVKEKELKIWRKICLRIKRLDDIYDQARQFSKSSYRCLTHRDG